MRKFKFDCFFKAGEEPEEPGSTEQPTTKATTKMTMKTTLKSTVKATMKPTTPTTKTTSDANALITSGLIAIFLL